MLYIAAGQIIEKAYNKEGSIKSLVFATGLKDVKQLYALVCQTLKYSNVLEKIIVAAGILEQEPWLKEPVARCMTYDLLFGKGVKCRGKFKRAMKRHTKSLEGALASLKKTAKVKNIEDLLPQIVREKLAMPRYIRVNRLKSTPQRVEDVFKAEGYECVLTREEADERMSTTDPTINSTQCHHHIKNLQPKQFMADLDLSDVFVFPPKTDLHDHRLFNTREILLQDKASCVPATVLAPPPGSHVIDACAAPGNKTSHLAAIMDNKGQIYAFDSSKARYHTLKDLVPKAGVTIASLRNQDFLQTNPHDDEFSSVEYILVDPSCSGTGMVGRKDYLTDGDEGPSQERLERLSAVQLKLLNHALSFPKAKRVVYSTCSVHAEENEEVVRKALEENPAFELKRVLPPWGQNAGVNTTGKKDPEISRINSLCLHALSNEHLTNGFFVALFEKSTAKFDIMAQMGMKRHLDDEDEEEEGESDNQLPQKKTKKKKRKNGSSDQNENHLVVSEEIDSEKLSKSSRKKKKKSSAEEVPTNDSISQDDSQLEFEDSELVESDHLSKSGKKKKKKHHQVHVEEEAGKVDQELDLEDPDDMIDTIPETQSPKKKKKKKSRKSIGDNM